MCVPLVTGAIGAVSGGYAAYKSGGSVGAGVFIGFVGGAVTGIPGTLLRSLGYGVVGGAIGGAAGDLSNANIPSVENLAFGGALGVMGAPFGSVGRAVLGSEVTGAMIAGTATGITDMANSSASARRANARKLYDHQPDPQPQQCRVR